MNTIDEDRLAELTAAALERTAFVMSEPVAVEAAALHGATRGAAIRYRGPSAGEVALWTGDGFLRALASSLLGVEPEEIDVARQGEDALRELANIVGGSVVAFLGGEESAFLLGLPAILPGARPPAPGERAGSACALDCEGHPLFVSWRPDAAPGARAG